MEPRKAKYYRTTEEAFEMVIWHAWGQLGGDAGQYPAAIIEMEDGSVEVCDADRLKFADRLPGQESILRRLKIVLKKHLG